MGSRANGVCPCWRWQVDPGAEESLAASVGKLQAAAWQFEAQLEEAEGDIATVDAQLPDLAIKVHDVEEQLPGMRAQLEAVEAQLAGLDLGTLEQLKGSLLGLEDVQREVGEAVRAEVERAERRAAQQLARSEEGVRAELADMARQLAAAEARILGTASAAIRRALQDEVGALVSAPCVVSVP